MNHRLRNARQNAEITQQEISNRTGFTQGQISNWENGARISLVTAQKIAKALGIPLQELLIDE